MSKVTATELNRLMLDALKASADAGYLTGKWVSNNPHTTDVEYHTAQVTKDEAQQAMWRAFYDFVAVETEPFVWRELCTGSGKPVGSASRCEMCGESFGFPHPAGLTVGAKAPGHYAPETIKFADEKRDI